MAARLRRALAARRVRPALPADLRRRRPATSAARRGAAALARPRARRLVPPGEFIPVAEETGLIEPIGDWVVGAVCAQQVAWAARGLRAADRLQRLAAPAAAARLHGARGRAPARTGADPARLTVELTESATMQDPADAEPILRAPARARAAAGPRRLRRRATRRSSRLREMPVDTLKIDRAFLRAVPESREASALVTAILDLARALGPHRGGRGRRDRGAAAISWPSAAARSPRASCSPARCRPARSRRWPPAASRAGRESIPRVARGWRVTVREGRG